MPLGDRFVVAPALREGEAVVCTGVDLDLARRPRRLEVPAELLDHFKRGDLVVLGARVERMQAEFEAGAAIRAAGYETIDDIPGVRDYFPDEK